MAMMKNNKKENNQKLPETPELNANHDAKKSEDKGNQNEKENNILLKVKDCFFKAIEYVKSTFNFIKDKFYEKHTAKRIESLRYQINLHKEYPGLRKVKNENHIEKLIADFNEKKYIELGKIELHTVQVDEEFEIEYAKNDEKRNKQKELDFRAAKMNIYAENKLLDKNYHLVGKVSADVKAKIKAAKEDIEKKYKDMHDQAKKAFLEKNPKRSAEVLKKNAELFALAEANYKTQLKNYRAELEAKYEVNLKDYTVKEEAKVAKLQAELAVEEKKMAEIIEANNKKYGEYQLPKDVILRLEGLSMHFGGLKAVDNVSVDIKEGEVFGLIGPNGAGKTTVFNCITQFYKPTLGKVWFKDTEGRALCLNDYAVHNVIKLGIVRTFQNVELIPELTVLQNLLIASHTEIKTNLFHHMVQTSRVKQEEAILYNKAMRVLEYLDLTSLKDVPPVGLPYGILKKIELARTLMADARLIILDEPAAGLNDTETADLAKIIKKIQKDFHVTIFLVEHDMGLVMGICDHICAISFGKKLAYGTPKEIQADPVVQEAYLGSED